MIVVSASFRRCAHGEPAKMNALIGMIRYLSLYTLQANSTSAYARGGPTCHGNQCTATGIFVIIAIVAIVVATTFFEIRDKRSKHVTSKWWFGGIAAFLAFMALGIFLEVLERNRAIDLGRGIQKFVTYIAAYAAVLWCFLEAALLWLTLRKGNRSSGNDYGSPNVQPTDSGAGRIKFCPRCGASMKIRTAGRGQRAGSKFYGCSNYPRCKGTREFDETT